eukprot:4053618-Prymnesium_polylepis.1
MKSHDCTRLSGSTIRLCAFAASHASVCSHPFPVTYSHTPRYGISHLAGGSAVDCLRAVDCE